MQALSALDSLDGLIKPIWDWEKRIDSMGEQIEERQTMLASADDSVGGGGVEVSRRQTRSKKRRGSLETLNGDEMEDEIVGGSDGGEVDSRERQPKQNPISPNRLRTAAKELQSKGLPNPPPALTSSQSRQSPTPMKAQRAPPRSLARSPSQTPHPETQPSQPLDRPLLPSLSLEARRMPSPAAHRPASPSGASETSSVKRRRQRETPVGINCAQATATPRQAMRKRPRDTSSQASGNQGGGMTQTAPHNRAQEMVVVYYDSFVQDFFGELVKFVSLHRNLLRKAKMAARVKEMRRLAEAETPSDDQEGDHHSPPPAPSGTVPPVSAQAALPSAISASPSVVAAAAATRRIATHATTDDPDAESAAAARVASSTRPSAARLLSSRYFAVGSLAGGGSAMMTGRGGMPAGRGGVTFATTVYDELDRKLDFVQSKCEQAAYQFLRLGECNESMSAIRVRLVEARELAEKELARLKIAPEQDTGADAHAAVAAGDCNIKMPNVPRLPPVPTVGPVSTDVVDSISSPMLPPVPPPRALAATAAAMAASGPRAFRPPSMRRDQMALAAERTAKEKEKEKEREDKGKEHQAKHDEAVRDRATIRETSVVADNPTQKKEPAMKASQAVMV